MGVPLGQAVGYAVRFSDTSATIDPQRFSRHFGDALVVGLTNGADRPPQDQPS
jgi:HrpA-like RNA helicase